jgi:hypothetical protein
MSANPAMRETIAGIQQTAGSRVFVLPLTPSGNEYEPYSSPTVASLCGGSTDGTDAYAALNTLRNLCPDFAVDLFAPFPVRLAGASSVCGLRPLSVREAPDFLHLQIGASYMTCLPNGGVFFTLSQVDPDAGTAHLMLDCGYEKQIRVNREFHPVVHQLRMTFRGYMTFSVPGRDDVVVGDRADVIRVLELTSGVGVSADETPRACI